ncbi:MAG: aminotransferase class V-fold PLP-dependent enzyme [Gammaproteobacteria bacterium]|nr:aminotransferase class V-fold PLP-dependent enzyme [Gammaproteobacteria bacterium]
MKNHFKLDTSLIYVNHAAVAPWPVCTVEAVKNFAEENGRIGSRHYNRWMQVEAELKQNLATLINAPSADDIALLKNTSEGLSVIAYGLDWQSGDNIVLAQEEFPSNRIVWESLKSQGVEIRLVDLAEAATPEQSLMHHMDDSTRLLSVSAVQYASGIRMDLQQLGRHCKHHGALFCVDAIQQIGAVTFDVQAIDADFVVADGHKWMLGPEGLALFYCKQALLAKLKLNQYGWHMVEDHLNFDNRNWKPAASARRFECGSPNVIAAHALHASIKLLLEIGMAEVEQRVLEKNQYLINAFSALPGVTILSPTSPDRYAGIFTFKKAGVDTENLYNWLVDKGVVCALRGGGIRFSPHFYTPDSQLATLTQWIAEY